DLRPRPKFQAAHYRAAGKLSGKAALITGGDSGIGRAVAVLYAREGADVAIVYLAAEQPDADETRAAVEKEGRKCVLIPGDLTDAAFCRDAVERAVRGLGKLDILVSNAAHQDRKKGWRKSATRNSTAPSAPTSMPTSAWRRPRFRT